MNGHKMRHGLAGIVGLAMFGSVMQAPSRVQAGEKEWATAGKILAGVVGFEILRRNLTPAPAPRRYGYGRPASVMLPPHRVVHTMPMPVAACPSAPVQVGPCRVWRDGHYIYIPRQEWIDTSYEVEEWVSGHRRPDGAWVDGHRIRRTVSQGYWRRYDEKVWMPAGYY